MFRQRIQFSHLGVALLHVCSRSGGEERGEIGQVLQVTVDSTTPALLALVVHLLHVVLQSCLVSVLVSTGWTHVVDTLHVLDQLVGHLEHLLTILTRKKLTRGLVLPDVDLQIEGFGEGDHTLLALKNKPISEKYYLQSTNQ